MAQISTSSTPPPTWYRYAIVLIGFMTLAGGSALSNCFAIFYSTLLEEFAWSHAQGALVYSVNMVVLAVSAPFVGWCLDRFGPRWLFTLAALLSGVALMACSTLRTLGEFMLYYGGLSALGQTALAPVAVMVSRWFAREQRGRAIGCTDIGTGFGTVVFVPATAWCIQILGWRHAFIVLGAMIMAVLVPLNLLHRPPPERAEEHRLAATTRTAALRQSALWLLCLVHFFMTITMTMVNVHLVEFFVTTGTLPRLQAATVLGSVSLVSLGGRMFFGWLADRLHGEGAFSLAMSCTVSGFVMLLLLAQGERPWALYAFVPIYGFAQGAGGIAVAAKTVELFPGPYLGTMFMVVNLSASLGAACGAWVGGRLFDVSGSYILTFATAIVSGMIAIGCMWLVRLASRHSADNPSPGARAMAGALKASRC